MAEGDGLKYRIEFEVDEESLIDAIGDAIEFAKPEIDSRVREAIKESMEESMKDTIKETTNDIRFDSDRDAMLAEDLGKAIEEARHDTSPVPFTTDRTVLDMLQDAVSVLEAPSIEMESVIRTSMTVMMNQIMDYIATNTSDIGRMLLKSTINEVVVHSARFAGLTDNTNLGSIIQILDRITERFERTGEFSWDPSIRDFMLGMFNEQLGVRAMARQIQGEDGTSERMMVKDLMKRIGVTPEDSESIRDILETWIQVAIKDSGIVIGTYDPIIDPEAKARLDRVVEYLEENVQLGGIRSSERESLGLGKWRLPFGEDPELNIRRFGTIIAKEIREIEELEQDVIPPSPFGPMDDAPMTRISFDDIVGALNRIVEVLERIGESEAAREAKDAFSSVLGKEPRPRRMSYEEGFLKRALDWTRSDY